MFRTFLRLKDARRSAELLVVCSVLFASTGQIAIKAGVGRLPGLWTRSPWVLHRPFTIGVLAGLCIYGIGTLLWIAAVSRERISYLYPLASMNYILVALGGWLILREPQHPSRWLGILVMSFGIALLSRTANGSPTANRTAA